MNLRLKTAMIVGGISVITAALMQLFNGVYFLRDLPSIYKDLPFFFVIVTTITLTACVLIAVRMGPLVRVSERIGDGNILLEERLRARKRLAEVSGLVVLVNIVGFFLGPIISITTKALISGTAINVLDTLLYIALNISIGLMAALQEITLIESATVASREALGIEEFSATRGEITLRTRLVLVVLGAAVLTGTLVTMAGLGFLREISLGSVVTVGDWRYIGQMAILVLLAIGWALLLVVTTAHALLTQVGSLGKRMSDIASGEADLSTRMYIVQFDEIGRLTGAINSVIRRLHSLVDNVRGAALGVSSSSIHLADSTKAATRTVQGIGETLGRVREAVTRQNETVDGAHASIAKLASSIGSISEQVVTQASYVEESSAAITQIAASITSVSNLAAEANGIARSLREVSLKGDANIREMEKSMEEITHASDAVSEIVGVISRIASQTNLLAMNAAIEAAHAGESGRGFAVVADEVRGLAETSAGSAKQVIQVIKQMRAKIDAGVALSDLVKNAFGSITQGITSAAGLIETIASSMSEQKAGADEVLGSVGSLIDATAKIKTGTVEQSESSGDMQGAVGRIVEAAKQIDAALEAQVKGMEDLIRVIEKVNIEANVNRARMSELESLFGGFTLKKE
jgi:methyl-accepting chemotaxis protein